MPWNMRNYFTFSFASSVLSHKFFASLRIQSSPGRPSFVFLLSSDCGPWALQHWVYASTVLESFAWQIPLVALDFQLAMVSAMYHTDTSSLWTRRGS